MLDRYLERNFLGEMRRDISINIYETMHSYLWKAILVKICQDGHFVFISTWAKLKTKENFIIIVVV